MKRKNKLLTILFACFPGAGHMYLGLMMSGLSFMLIFWGLICLTILLSSLLREFGFLLALLPIPWFYAFFDAINQWDRIFVQGEVVEDSFWLPDMISYLSGVRFPRPFRFHSRVPRILLGVGLVLVALRQIGEYVMDILCSIGFFEGYRWVIHSFDSIWVSLLLLALGGWLIFGKGRQIHQECQEIKELSEHHEG